MSGYRHHYHWQAISPDLTNGSGGGNLTFGTLYSFDVSTLDSNVIITGADDGTLSLTTDGGGNWTTISADLPDRWVTKVLASRFDAQTFYVTFSGYRFGEDNGHVYKTTDNGANWTDIGTSLPDIPVNDIVQDAWGILFLATDVGVLASDDEGANRGETQQLVGPSRILGSLFDAHLSRDCHGFRIAPTRFAAGRP